GPLRVDYRPAWLHDALLPRLGPGPDVGLELRSRLREAGAGAARFDHDVPVAVGSERPDAATDRVRRRRLVPRRPERCDRTCRPKRVLRAAARRDDRLVESVVRVHTRRSSEGRGVLDADVPEGI